MGGRYLSWLLLTLLFGTSGADAAHEWRGYWGGPSTFEALRELLPPGGQPLGGTDPAKRRSGESGHPGFRGTPRLEFSHRRPFSLPGISFEKLRWRMGLAGLEVHLGWLHGPAYQEWHAGVGGVINGGALRLFWGGRIFGLLVEGVRPDPIPAATVLCNFRPSWLSRGGLTAGVVDLGFGPEGDLSPVFVLRIGAGVSAADLLLERSAVYPARSETTLLAKVHLPALALVQGFRWATGESLLEVEFAVARCTIQVGGCWHPDLGWTPRFGFRLLAQEASERTPR